MMVAGSKLKIKSTKRHFCKKKHERRDEQKTNLWRRYGVTWYLNFTQYSSVELLETEFMCVFSSISSFSLLSCTQRPCCHVYCCAKISVYFSSIYTHSSLFHHTHIYHFITEGWSTLTKDFSHSSARFFLHYYPLAIFIIWAAYVQA